MASSRNELSSHLTGPAYAIGVLFAIEPILDTFAQVWPPSPGNPSWRFGLVGVGANYLLSVAFGLLLITFAASAGWHRRTLRVLAVLELLGAVALLGALVSFALDALQLRPGIPAAQTGTLRTFDLGTKKAAYKYVVSAAALVWMAFAAWRAARAIPARDAEAPKLVGKAAPR